MLDIGFSELLLIALVAIVVVGPEKLPETITNILKYIRKIAKYIGGIKENIDRELQIQELREEANRYRENFLTASRELEQMANQDIRQPLKSGVDEVNVTLKKSSAKDELEKVLKGN
jgi:sec-independent protein translocase protein TatB